MNRWEKSAASKSRLISKHGKKGHQVAEFPERERRADVSGHGARGGLPRGNCRLLNRHGGSPGNFDCQCFGSLAFKQTRVDLVVFQRDDHHLEAVGDLDVGKDNRLENLQGLLPRSDSRQIGADEATPGVAELMTSLARNCGVFEKDRGSSIAVAPGERWQKWGERVGFGKR